MMSRSAQHEPEVDVMGHRLRRVLVPLWVFGIVAVPLMLWQGWGVADDANPFFVANLVFWIFPFLDPPGSTAAADLIGGLWYIRACLWFVLLTPLMRAGLRRSPDRGDAGAAGRRRARRLAELGPVVQWRHRARV